MINKQNRIITIFVGFLLLIIPITFFVNSLKDLYTSSKEKTLETLRQSILVYARKIEDDMNPLNYLKLEFSKIHADLIPDFPNEIIKGIPDKNYIDRIYNKQVFDKLLSNTKEKYAPVLIIFGTNNLEKIYYYCSPELINDFENPEDKKTLLRIKARYDAEILTDKYKDYFKPKYFLILDNNYWDPNDKDLINNRDKDPCYKYISRYKRLKNNYSSIYTDYFDKQSLYPIIQYTFSQYGLHGYYSLLIPQSHVDPDNIIKSVLSNKDKDIKIDIEKGEIQDQLIEKSEGIEYYLNFPTYFINHVKTFSILGGAPHLDLLEKHLKLSINYPNDIILLEKMITISKSAAIIISILYFIISIWLLKTQKQLNMLITRKIICVLSIIIFFPILAIMIFVNLSLHNIDEYIMYNVSKCLHNQLEIHRIQDQENTIRWVSSIFELKKRISRTKLQPENLFNGILTPQEANTWFFTRYNGLLALSDKNEAFAFKDYGVKNESMMRRSSDFRFFKQLLGRYINNLGITKNSIKSKSNKNSDVTQFFSLGILEEYFSLEQEEKTLSQESVPNTDLLNFMKKELAIFFLAKDINRTNYIMYTKKTNSNERPYNYISNYTEKIDPFWFTPYNRFAEMNLAIVFRIDSNNKIKQWPPFISSNKEINDTISLLSETNDSGVEKIQNSKETIIKEWMVESNDTLMFLGIAKRTKDTSISYSLQIFFIIILIYAVLILLLLTDFISVFIYKPIQIYKEAIEKLSNNQYGITIHSFSKDEFNNITKAFNEMSIAIKQKEQIKRYVSDKLIESVKENNVQEAGKGKQEVVTILSSDIRNFTGISEMYDPSVIVEMLNTYFTQMQKAISDNGGIIDKYIGDAIQAVFYDEPQKGNQVIRAAKAAVSMRKALDEYNKNREESGLFTIQNGIGIDTDIAITGTIGTTNGRKDFSVNGDVIARAANLEAKTKNTKSKILISKTSLTYITSKKDGLPQLLSEPSNDDLVYSDFDEESVELIDVSK